MKGKLKFLGTGSSVGVPLIGCQCNVCTSASLMNKRFRPSVLIQLENRQFVIDAGPDFRMQALHHHLNRMDGVILTHAHQDHTAGLDDLRPYFFWMQHPLPLLLSSDTAKDIKHRFHYLFEGDKDFVSRFNLNILPDSLNGKIVFEKLKLEYVTYSQAGMAINGYRIGNIAYLTDIREYSPDIWDHLKGVKYLIISALRRTPSPLHFSVDEAVDFSKKLNVEKTWLTHISHDLEHEQTNAYLPSNIQLAYDGLEIEFEYI